MELLSTRGSTRAILAASLGNLLEWYDFAVYALFAIYIGANFFPHDSAAAGLVSAFLVFGLGFVIRPLGAVLIGIYGDRAGRKAALTATILIMAGGTLIIAAAPTYAAIGLGAPLVLLAGRVLQGFSAGGEIGSATAFLVEHAPPARKALFTAWLQGSMGMSNILGALVAFTITALLPQSEIIRWAWRVPFFLGLAIVPVGVYLRRTLEETPAFRAEAVDRSRRAPAAARGCSANTPPELAAGFGISILWAAEVYVLLIFMPVFLQRALGFTPAQAFGGSLLENVVFVAGCFVFGALADRVGHLRIQAYGAASDAHLRAAALCVARSFSLGGGADLVVCCLRVDGRELFGRRADDAIGTLPHFRPGDRRLARLQCGLHVVRRIRARHLDQVHGRGLGAAYAPAWFVMLAAIPALIALRFEAGHRSATAPVVLGSG